MCFLNIFSRNSSTLNKLYNPKNTNGKKTNDVSSAKAFLIYISVNLYGAKIYIMPDNIAILLFFVTFLVNKYIKYPDRKTLTNMNNFIHVVNDAPINLNINGKKAVNGL
jgi:hypothetical protein